MPGYIFAPCLTSPNATVKWPNAHPARCYDVYNPWLIPTIIIGWRGLSPLCKATSPYLPHISVVSRMWAGTIASQDVTSTRVHPLPRCNRTSMSHPHFRQPHYTTFLFPTQHPPYQHPPPTLRPPRNPTHHNSLRSTHNTHQPHDRQQLTILRNLSHRSLKPILVFELHMRPIRPLQLDSQKLNALLNTLRLEPPGTGDLRRRSSQCPGCNRCLRTGDSQILLPGTDLGAAATGAGACLWGG